jgi:hypothetical protein
LRKVASRSYRLHDNFYVPFTFVTPQISTIAVLSNRRFFKSSSKLALGIQKNSVLGKPKYKQTLVQILSMASPKVFGNLAIRPRYLWPVHLNDKNVSSRDDTFLSWYLAPASEVAGGHTLPF